MTPEAIKALRKDLDCTATELGAAIGTDQATVLAWERGDLFPTRRFVEAMAALARQGAAAFPRQPPPCSCGDRKTKGTTK